MAQRGRGMILAMFYAVAGFMLIRFGFRSTIRRHRMEQERREDEARRLLIPCRIEGKRDDGETYIFFGVGHVSNNDLTCYFNHLPPAHWRAMLFTFGGIDFSVDTEFETTDYGSARVVCLSDCTISLNGSSAIYH